MFDIRNLNLEATETIDLDKLRLDNFSQTGSFLLSGLERTVVGKFLSAIPMPVMLVTMPDARVRFLNSVAEEMLKEFALVIGDPLFKLIKSDVQTLQRALNKVFATRKQQRLEAWITGAKNSKWARIHLRSLRLSAERFALVLIEDLTHEKEALGQKARQLKVKNELLEAEIIKRRKIELRLKQAWAGTIRVLAKMSEMKDPHTAGHQERVARLTAAIALQMGVKEQERNLIVIAAEVHDIGKLSVPVELLSKPSTLSEAEYGILKEHPRKGCELLEEAHIPKTVTEAVLQHHERMNGQGYPEALKGYNIVLGARIIGVADVVEAMSSQRTYRPARGLNQAAKEISKNKGVLYDPKVVDACIKVLMSGFRFGS